MGLSKREMLFVEAFDGDEIYALRIAGYTGADAYLRQLSSNLLKRPDIIEAIKHRDDFKTTTNKVIANREERQALWTSIMRNNDPYHREEVDANGIPIPEANIPIPIRLKASELLGKSEADFVEKIDINAQMTITDVIRQSYLSQDDEDIDAIEAEYNTLKEKPLLNIGIPKPEEGTTLEDFL